MKSRFRFRNILPILVCALAVSAFGEKKESALEGDQAVFGLGPILGVPTGPGLQLGVWNLGPGAFVNVSGGYFGLGATLKLEGGYMFDKEGTFKQGLSLNVGGTYFILPLIPVLLGEYWVGWFGPSYKMLFWDLVYVDLGVGASFTKPGYESLFFIPLESRNSVWGIVPIVNVGMVWFL